MAEEKKQKVVKKSVIDIKALTLPDRGTLTFNSEGHEGGKWASRYPHVPDDNSGVTIGRGYDMKSKSKAQMQADFIKAGINQEDAKKFFDAAHIHIKGPAAEKFIQDKKLEEFSITPIQQAKLFEISFDREAAEVKRICTKKDVQATYGKCDWDRLNPAIKEILVDLKFRGDYTPNTRKLLQKHAADNNLEEFAKVIQNEENWNKVPADRFKSRSKFMEEQLKLNKSNTFTIKPNTLTTNKIIPSILGKNDTYQNVN